MLLKLPNWILKTKVTATPLHAVSLGLSDRTHVYSLFQWVISLSRKIKHNCLSATTPFLLIQIQTSIQMNHIMNCLIRRQLLIEKESTSQLRASSGVYAPDDGQRLGNYCFQLYLISVPHSLRCNKELCNTNYSNFSLRQTHAHTGRCECETRRTNSHVHAMIKKLTH
jgi:hypothetical protein